MDDDAKTEMSEDDLVLKNLSNVTTWNTILSDDKDGYYSVVNTLDEVSSVIREYEKLTVSQFITTVTNGDWKPQQRSINIGRSFTEYYQLKYNTFNEVWKIILHIETFPQFV